MKQIQLTQGKFALVDDEDFEFLNQWKWCAQNTQNTKLSNDKKSKCTSIYRGVIKLPKYNKWKVRIRFNNLPIHLGYFNTELEAAIAYNTAAVKYHGEFATLNIIP